LAGSNAAGRCLAATATCVLLGLAGCVTQPDVRPLATGRADVSAYELNGGDLQALRQAAQRLCPMGGQIVREAGHSLPPEAEAGRWRSTVNTLSAWMEPPRRPAQMVVLCREPGDRQQLQPQPPRQQPVPQPPAAPAEVTAGLPIGPISPEW
jgi:hypothetical protein